MPSWRYHQMPEASNPTDPVAAKAAIALDEEILEQLDVYGFPREYPPEIFIVGASG